MSNRDDKQTTTQEPAPQSQELAVMAPSLVERFESRMAAIPEADPAEATEQIVFQIMDAEIPEDLDAPWSGESIKGLNGRELKVLRLKRLPSDYKGGPRWYLGADCVLVATGESLFVSISSISCMAQLITAHAKGWLPLGVVVRQAERQSSNGFFPMHLEIVRGQIS